MTSRIDQPRSNPRIALVTGGGRNIGRAIALDLAGAGADVAVLVRSDGAAAEGVADEVRALGRRALTAVADVRDESAVGAAVDRVREELGPVTVLVHAAKSAVHPWGPP